MRQNKYHYNQLPLRARAHAIKRVLRSRHFTPPPQPPEILGTYPNNTFYPQATTHLNYVSSFSSPLTIRETTLRNLLTGESRGEE
jgi:hypothetical protein